GSLVACTDCQYASSICGSPTSDGLSRSSRAATDGSDGGTTLDARSSQRDDSAPIAAPRPIAPATQSASSPCDRAIASRGPPTGGRDGDPAAATTGSTGATGAANR